MVGLVTNRIALLSLLAGFIVGYVVQECGARGDVPMVMLLLTAAAIDGVYRLSNNVDRGWRRLWASGTGGHVSFIPLWIAGLVLATFGMGEPHRCPDRPQPPASSSAWSAEAEGQPFAWDC